jgi:alkylation response protein AidB-like acyl-CoA dehydrogenase
VDFELTSDQVDLQDGVRKLCEGRFPMETVRGLEATGGIDRSLWQELADAGVFALRLAEDEGGVGLGAAESVIVFEQLGRSLVPGPLVATELASSLVPGAATGEAIVGIVEGDQEPLLVGHLAGVDRLLVLGDDGVRSLDPGTLDATAVERPIDPLTPLHHVASLPEGEQVGDAAVAERLRLHGALLTAALQLGAAAAVTDLAVAYAKEREQFGRPIGSFQAIKHILADMLAKAEMARAAVYAAGVTVDQPDVGNVRRAVSAAKVIAGEAAIHNGKMAIQVHGGMGFTWEVDAHLYLKRSWVLDTTFGSIDHHVEVLADLL